MREITRSVKVALKCLIAVVLIDVDLPYWTSKVEHLVAFAAIVSNICTAHAQKRLFMHLNYARNLDTAVRFADPDFLFECKISAIWRRFTLILHLIFWISAIFLLPVCLTYWPRKYTTRVDPNVDNSHQVWSWYDHALPSIAFLSADKSRDFQTLIFDLLTLNICCVWRVTWPILLPSLKTLCLSVLDLWVITFPAGYYWECVRGHCACTESRDPWVGGQKQLHFWSPQPWFAYSLSTFGGSTMNVIKVICENISRSCVERRMSFCACAKSRDVLKVT